MPRTAPGVERDLVLALSAIDEERFGVRSARAENCTADTLPRIDDFCRSNAVKFLIARCNTRELDAVRRMEETGYRLMDTLVYFQRSLVRDLPEDTGRNVIVPIAQGDEVQVERVAAEAFTGYYGHYHADPRLPQALCDQAYVSWAVRSAASREVADEVLVAKLDEKIVGFATLRRHGPDEGEGVLFGVLPSAQGRGVYRSFMIRGMEWCRATGAKRMTVATQITNLAVQKVWSRLGFEPSDSCYTFHKWFD